MKLFRMQGIRNKWLCLFLCLFAFPCNAFLLIGGTGATAIPSGTSVNYPTGNLVALYSVIQQIGWNGSCLRVQRSSDNTQLDIGFVNGVMDINTALSFAGSSTAYVVKWYDESGNGNDATQATVANAPVLSSANIYNSIPSITTWSTGQKYFSLPNAISLDRQNNTIFSTHLMNSASGGAPWQLNTTSSAGLVLKENTSNDQLYDGAAFRNTTIYSNSQPVVSATTSTSGSKTYQMNNTLVTGLGASAAGTMTGGALGDAPDIGYAFLGELYSTAIYSTALSQSTMQSTVTSLLSSSSFNIPTTAVTRVLFDGDSITEGYGSTLGINNPRQLIPLLTKVPYIRDIGIFGQLFSTCLTNETINVTNSYKAGMTNILIIDAGINDISNGTTGTNLYNNDLVPYVNSAKTTGYQVLVGTLIYDASQTTAQNNERITYNGLVRANASSLGITVVDYDSITQLQNPQTAGYSFDGIHPTTLGYGLMAQTLYPIINPLIQ